jgi:hypothetical protein
LQDLIKNIAILMLKVKLSHEMRDRKTHQREGSLMEKQSNADFRLFFLKILLEVLNKRMTT